MKIVTYIFDAETVTSLSAKETSNCIIATETITCMIATERPINITVTGSTIWIVAIESHILHKDMSELKSVSYIVPTETVTCRIDYL